MRTPIRSALGLILAAALAGGLPRCGGGGGGDHGGSSGFFQLNDTVYLGGEDGGPVTITVLRRGPSAGAVTVDYVTADGTATAGQDYVSVTGTLAWADGDGTPKTFDVPLIDDFCIEGDETLVASIINPTGNAYLGVPADGDIIIGEDDVLPSGSLDPLFGTGGCFTVDPSAGSDIFTTVDVDGGFVYAVGWDETPGPSDWQWRIEKRDAIDGVLVPGFGQGGVVGSNSNALDASPFAMLVDSGFIYVTGYDMDPTNLDWRWRLEKRNTLDGDPDPLFGNGGAIISNPSGLYESPMSVAVDRSFVYITGDDASPGPGDWRWRIEKRDIIDGALDPNFGQGGVVTSDPSLGDDMPYGIAVDASFVYVIGYDESPGPGDWQWRIEKRDIIDGTPDPVFGIGGAVTSDPSFGDDSPFALAIDGSHIYGVGYDETPGTSDFQWRIEKRSTIDGDLDPNFGTGGVFTENPSPWDDQAWYLVIDSTYMYVSGYDDSLNGDPQWRIMKISLQDGALDSCFGSGGVVTSNPSMFDDTPWWIAADSHRLYIVGDGGVLAPGDIQMRIEKRVK